MKKILLLAALGVFVLGFGAVAVIAATVSPAPSVPVERVIANDHFPS